MIRNDRVVWAEGFGWADIERQRKATANSIYLLASVSKPITSTALMKLVDEGKLDLDAPANRYLDEALIAHRGRAEDITLRRLANHSSGMPVHWTFFYPGFEKPTMAETIRRYGFAARAPGSGFEYCNLAFGVLDHIVGKVSGEGFGPYVERAVFDAIGMKRSGLGVREAYADDASVPYRHDWGGTPRAVPPYDFDHPGASAFWSSAYDLGRFLRLFFHAGELDGQRLLAAETAQEMLTPRARDIGSSFGVGWSVADCDEGKIFSHSGGMPGVSTKISGHNASKNGYVVLTNSSRRQLTNTLSAALDRRLFPAKKRGETKSPFRPGGDLNGRWSGKIHHHLGAVSLALEIEGQQVRIIEGKRKRLLQNSNVNGGRLGLQIGQVELATMDGFTAPPSCVFGSRSTRREFSEVSRSSPPAMVATDASATGCRWSAVEKRRRR